MNALRAWARASRDVAIDWSDVSDALLEAIDRADLYHRASFAIWFSTAHSRLARRVEELVSEFRAVDPACIKRWSGEGDR